MEVEFKPEIFPDVEVCLVCSASIVEKRTSMDFTHVLFVLKHVLKVSNERLEKLIIKFFSERCDLEEFENTLLCNHCGQAVETIIAFHNNLLETSKDICEIKRKLFPGKYCKRKVQVVCDEDDELEEVKRVKKRPRGLREEEKNVKSGKRSNYRLVRRKGVDKFKSQVIEPAIQASFLPVESSSREDADPEYSPDPGCELLSSSDSERRSRSSSNGPPKKKRHKTKIRPKVHLERESERPVAKLTKRQLEYRTKNVSMKCPFCKTFNGSSLHYLSFCKHLNECSMRSGGCSFSVTCVKCNTFTTSDLVLFSEHFGACPVFKHGGVARGVISIKKRIVSCDACVPTRYFKFEGFLWHYVLHQRRPFKCTFVKRDGSICGLRKESEDALSSHWISTHRIGNGTGDSKKTYILDPQLPAVPWFCYLCNMRFSTMQQRNVHLSSDHPDKVLPPLNTHKCEHCPFTSFLKEDVSIHFTIEHHQLATPPHKPPPKTMKCPFCKQFDGSSETVLEFCHHLRTCSKTASEEALPIACVTCNHFTTSDFLHFSEHFGDCQGEAETHGKVVVPIQSRIVPCDACVNSKSTDCFRFSDFLQHYVYHHRFNLKCKYIYEDGTTCGARYGSKYGFSPHWKLIHRQTIPVRDSFVLDTSLPSVPWFCHLCNSRFHSLEARNAHVNSDHSHLGSSRKTFNCENCAFTSCLQEDIQIHRTLEHTQFVKYSDKLQRSYQCDICQHYLPTQRQLEDHKDSEHNHGTIPSSSVRRRPVQTVQYRHACSECPKKYVLQHQLVSHQIRTHNRTDLGKDPLECDICEWKCRRMDALKMHKSAVHERNKRQFICEICATSVGSKQSLQRHLHRMHKVGAFTEFKCPEEGCGKTYDGKEAFQRHFAKNHSNTPLFNCEYCGKGYYHNGLLKKHLLYHKFPEFKVFSCELCPGKKFRTPENLTLHWKIHGPEEAERLRSKGIREEEREEFLRVVGKDYFKAKLLQKM